MIVRKPMTISRPASAGMAMWPTSPAKAKMTTAITAEEIISASLVCAPATLLRAEADIEPPTGMP